MSIFVDTSGIYAFVDRTDANHAAAAAVLRSASHEPLVTHNYVLVEAAALIQRRLGQVACRDFLVDFVPALDVFWVTELVHGRSAETMINGEMGGGVSLVDLVSFQVMRHLGVDRAFAFDSDFARHGFTLVPSPA